jgi:hypothetical protein
MLQNKLLLSVVAVLLAAFGFNHFLLSKKKTEKASLTAKIAKAQDEISTAQASLSANKDAQEGFREDYSTVVHLGKAVPGDDDVRSLVVQIDRAAHQANVDFKAIDVGGGGGAAPSTAPNATQLPPGTTIGPAGFPIMPFSFTFTGQFFRLGDFFRHLDAFVQSNNQKVSITGRLMTVDALKLEPDTTGFPNVKATVSATTYLVPPLEGLTGGATPAGPAGATAAAPPATGTTPGATTTAMVTGGYR